MKNNKLKKRSIIIGASFLVVCIITIVSVVLYFNLKNDNSTIKRGVHYSSRNIAGDEGELPSFCPVLEYYVDIEDDTYDYGEEFTIRYRMRKTEISAVSQGDLKIRIESENFEFLSPTEFIFSDFQSDEYRYSQDTNGNQEYLVDIEVNLKAIKENDEIDSICFLLEYNLEDKFKENELTFYDNRYWHGIKEEFTSDFKQIHRIDYINDELGTLLVDKSKMYEVSSDVDYDYSYMKKHYIFPRNGTMFCSLNRVYEKNLITKEEYLQRLYWHWHEKQTQIEVCYVGTETEFVYWSQNVIAKFSLNSEETVLLEELFEEDTAGSRIEIATILTTILYEENKLTIKEYENELELIQAGVMRYTSHTQNTDLIPFDVESVKYCKECIVER